jgi:hypothetical protein
MNIVNINEGALKYSIERLLVKSPVLIVFFLVLTPSIKLPNLPAIRLEQVTVLVVLLLEFYYYRLSRLSKVIRKRSVVFIAAILVLIITTIVRGNLLGYRIAYNDFYELFKVAFYFSTYIIVRLYTRSEEERKQLLHCIVFFIFIASIIAITQYFNFFNMNELYVRAIAPTQYKTLVNGYPSPRVIGITGNPNYFAIFAGIAGFISFREFISSGNWKSIVSTLYFFIIMNMTKSRTGFIFFVVGIFFLLLMEGQRRVKRIYSEKGSKNGNIATFKLLMILLLIGAGFILFIIFGPEALTWRLKHGMDILNDRSFMIRVSRWRRYVEIFDFPYFIGIGPTKTFHPLFQVDNEWLILLKEFGFAGTVFLALSFTIPFIKNKVNPYGDIYFAVISAGALFMMTSVFVSIYQVMPLVIILGAISRPFSDIKEDNKYEHTLYR